MKSSQLALLLRTHGGDAAAVAFHHIFTQKKLEEDDHAFLEQHLQGLGPDLLRFWLSSRPPNPARIVDALLVDWPSREDPGIDLAFGDFPVLAPKMAPDVLDAIADQLRPPRVEAWSWWRAAQHLAPHFKSTCPAFAASLELQEDCHLALALFDARREPAKVPAALKEAVHTGTLEERARQLASIARLGLLEKVDPADALPEEVTFAFEEHDHGDRPHTGQCFADIAREWPGEKAAQAHAWLVRQIVAAGVRGANWWELWYETPANHHDRVALEAAAAGRLAPWVLLSIRGALERREAGAWDLLFGYIDTPGALDLRSGPPSRMLFRGAVPGPFADRREDITDITAPSRLAARLLAEAPPPDTDEDAFEERLLAYRDRFNDCKLGEGETLWIRLFRRLASLPLTPGRANRLIGVLVEYRYHSFLLGDVKAPWSFLVELFTAAGPQPPERLPPLSVFTRGPEVSEGVLAYRRIAGPAAEEPLQAFLLEPFEAMAAEPELVDWSPDFYDALRRLIALPDLATDDLRHQLVNRVRKLSLRTMIDIHEGHGKELPWLVEGGESTLAEIALERADLPNERWIFWSVYDPKVDQLPAYLRPAIEQRVKTVRREDELIGLLRWLGREGEKPEKLIAVFLDWLARGEMSNASMTWLATVLSSRTRWDDLGPTLLGVFFDRGQLGAIVTLAGRCIPAESEDPAEKKRRQSLIAATHEALGRVLLTAAKQALEGGEPRKAIPALHALTALHPRTALVKKVHALLGIAGDEPDVVELLELNEQLLKHDTTNEARVLDLRMAISLFVDASARNRDSAA